MSSNIKSNTGSTPDAGISIGASDTAQPMRNKAASPDAGTNNPSEAPPTQTITAGGNGKDGTLSILAADDQPLFQTVRGSVGLNGALKHVAARIGDGTVGGVLKLVDREGKQSVQIDGTNGSLDLRSQIAMKGKDNNDQIILGATRYRSAMFIGAPERPGFIQLTTGGSPGPTIELDGERNSLLFQKKGSRTDSVLELNGNTATVRAGGNGKNGPVSVLGADGQPPPELLGRSNECVMGLGQKNRPARISLYGANQQEAIRLNAAAGDIMLMNADCAKEFGLAVQDVQPGTIMVLTDDGRLAPSSEPYDTRVTGVVSGAGTFRPGLVLNRRDTGLPRVPVALMGKVYCWVDATRAAIGVGDLLTTAEVPGHAMKVTELTRAIGAIIGKALVHWARAASLSQFW